MATPLGIEREIKKRKTFYIFLSLENDLILSLLHFQCSHGFNFIFILLNVDLFSLTLKTLSAIFTTIQDISLKCCVCNVYI